MIGTQLGTLCEFAEILQQNIPLLMKCLEKVNLVYLQIVAQLLTSYCRQIFRFATYEIANEAGTAAGNAHNRKRVLILRQRAAGAMVKFAGAMPEFLMVS